MFDIGWTELLVIGVVALIVVGPKDLPGMFRTLGRFTAKARSMAREFSRAMEDAADESGVGDVAKDLKSMTSAKNLGLDTMKDAVGKFEDWDPLKKSPTGKKGPATEALSKERAEVAKKIRETTAEKAAARLAKEASADGKAGKKPAAKKPAAKSPKKAASKAASAKTAPAKKPAVKKAKAAPKKATAKLTSKRKPPTKTSPKRPTK